MNTSWLVIIDPQVIFADKISPWCAPTFGEIIAPINNLVAHFTDQTIVTRWIPEPNHLGSWKDYFERWQFADQPPDSPLFDLVPAATAWAQTTLERPTFSKWGADLIDATSSADHLVLAGVSTDCCVISTALAAADAGVSVTVVADACAGSNGINHEAALHIMGLYDPQIAVQTSADLIASSDLI